MNWETDPKTCRRHPFHQLHEQNLKIQYKTLIKLLFSDAAPSPTYQLHVQSITCHTCTCMLHIELQLKWSSLAKKRTLSLLFTHSSVVNVAFYYKYSKRAAEVMFVSATNLAVTVLFCEIKRVMIHHVHKTLESWHVKLSVGTSRNGQKDFHKHLSKRMLHFLVLGIYKQGSTLLQTI